MSKKKDRGWFICPQWAELISRHYASDIEAGRALKADPKVLSNTDLLKFLDASVSFYLGHGSIAGASYGSDKAGAQATAQSERTKPVLVANRFHAISQASMMSARLRNTELASQWLRR
jgi:hypothetical protein